MPYNKGDFTQQGINGDVSALVRLNEKRVMKVVLSSDDESDNCDISGAVYDLLNGTSYPLGGSEPTGTITITENGTGIDVSQYALADVNVSGGGGDPTTEKHYWLNNVSFTSRDMGGVYGALIDTDTYGLFFYPIISGVIDNVEVTSEMSYGGTGDIYASLFDSNENEIAGIFINTEFGSGISFLNDTEPTVHNVSIYYEGYKVIFADITDREYSNEGYNIPCFDYEEQDDYKLYPITRPLRQGENVLCEFIDLYNTNTINASHDIPFVVNDGTSLEPDYAIIGGTVSNSGTTITVIGNYVIYETFTGSV